MKTAKLELIVGLFVLLGIGAISYLAVKIAGGTLFGNNTYTLTARFDKATGLNPGANVVISGVPVGRVETVKLDPQTFAAIIQLRVNRDIRLSSETSASIKTSGLIGDRYIAVEPGGDDTMIATDGSGKITETHGPVDIEDLISKFAFGSLNNDDKNETPASQ